MVNHLEYLVNYKLELVEIYINEIKIKNPNFYLNLYGT